MSYRAAILSALAAAPGLAGCTPPPGTPPGARMHAGTISEGYYWTTCIDTEAGFVELVNFSWGESVRAGAGLQCADAPLEALNERGETYSSADRALVKFGLSDDRIELLARRGPMEFGDQPRACPVQPTVAALAATAATIDEAANSLLFLERQRELLRARANDVRAVDPTRLERSGSSGSHEDTEFYCTDFGADRPTVN